MKARHLSSLAAIFGAFILLSACKPKAGAKCSDDGMQVCHDEKSALVCDDKQWKTMPCQGPAGCSNVGKLAKCDQSLAKVDDLCNLETNFACSDDKKTSLHCKGKKWQLDENCDGPKGCVANANEVSCDNSFAKDGSKCSHDESHACSTDKKSHFVCKGGKFGLVEYCRGDKGCRILGDKVDCDNSVANIGEPCGSIGNFTCALDYKKVLECRNNKYVSIEDCKGKQQCKIQGNEVGCR